MTVIYGLRAIGSDEVRYVGQSGKPLHLRLERHLYNAKRGYPTLISDWLRSAGPVEIVPLASCDAPDACAEERRLVEHHHARGDRLTNAHLVPRKPTRKSQTGTQ